MVRVSDPFKKAKPPEAKPPADVDKGTTWTVDEPTLTAAIIELNKSSAELKAVKVRFEAAQDAIQPYAEDRWLRHWISGGDQPETPVRIIDPATGAYASFVVQDKTKTAVATPKIQTALAEVLGPETVKAGLVETVVYSFNQDLLPKTVKDPVTGRQRPIQRMLADRIGPLLDTLVTTGQLQRDEADSLLTATVVHVFDRDFVPSLPALCKKRPSLLKAAVDALGSAIVRFIKAS